ncbi:hypothetical protein J2S43_002500 [Catenuloplanes nepalensis]|uniref:CopC domain-containing protein n=2 Tax=Catenuloplanes nepalensis TaxID=587533 RepID=A0ABT9MRD3_9ACTN|nr:hypothetical protein [Catenuloplanes nepalensis]
MPIRRKIAAAVAAGALVLLPAAPALAYEPVNVVHTEHVQAGPYEVTVGFSEWPLRAMQSMDVSFIPDGGIGGKSGTLHVTGPTRLHPNLANSTLARHPRKLDVWGLDVIALDRQGEYTFEFRIDGPQGLGEGQTRPVEVLSQPGPPLALSWAVCAIPLVGLLAFLVIAWRRHSVGRTPLHPPV